MAKGVSIKFRSYHETIPQLLKLLKLDLELKKHSSIVLKPNLKDSKSDVTTPEFVEPILKFCLEHKNPAAELLIAEGSDGEDTDNLFESFGYKKLAEKYSIGLVDLNNAETEEKRSTKFLKFDKIMYPKILSESFIISLPKLSYDNESELAGSLSNMLGAFSSKHYSGFFSSRKNKIRNGSIENSIHDIVVCRMPNFAIVDASSKGFLLAGMPLEIDKQSAKLLGEDWKAISHLKLMDESFNVKTNA